MKRGLRAALGAVAFLAAAGCATTQGETPAPSPTPEEAADLAALESAFWYCDYVATTHGVLATPMAACQFATNELKARRFGGSSGALEAWWRENKAAEHERQRRDAGVARPSR